MWHMSSSEKRYARPDASMLLLTNVMEHALDDGYEEAARRRGAVGSSRMPSSLRGKLVLGLGLALTAVVLTMGAVQVRSNAPVASKERQALIQRITQGTSSADALQKQVDALRGQVQRIQEQAIGQAGLEQVQQLELVTGYTAVTGPGVSVELNDAATVSGNGGTNPRANGGFGNTGRVRDTDVQFVVNALWQSGAEAVAINGQRLTTLSAIRAAGDAILVDNRPLVLPYTLQAIGGPDLQQNFQNNAFGGLYLQQLKQDYGIRYDVSSHGKLALPAAAGGTLHYAVPSDKGGTTP
jgi:uncharacterized protein YlxW (UPF0749 family)